MACIRIDNLQRGVGTVRPGWKDGISEDRMISEVVDEISDLLITAGNDNRTNIRFQPSLPNMGDHRLSVDVGEGLARKPG